MEKEKAKSILDKIKQLFAEGDPAPAADPVVAAVEPQSVNLKNGQIISISALEVGGDVLIEGSPAPAGEYELEDGRILVVGEDAKIAEIKPAPATEPAAPVVEPSAPAEDMGARFEALQAELNTHKEDFASYKASQEQKFSEQEAIIEKQGGILSQMFELVQALTEVPQADPPAGVVKASSRFSKVEGKNEKFNKYAQAAQKLAEEAAK